MKKPISTLAQTQDQQFATIIDADFLQNRWGRALQNGLLAVPTALLTCQSQLGLDSTSMLILMNLLATWGHQSEHPSLELDALAERMHLPITTLQERLGYLLHCGFIRRVPASISGGNTLTYDVSGLVGILKASGIDSIENQH